MEVEAETPENRKLREGERVVAVGEGNAIGKDGDAKTPDLLRSPEPSKPAKVQTGGKDADKPKPSKFKELLGKLGLDLGTVLMMFK